MDDVTLGYSLAICNQGNTRRHCGTQSLAVCNQGNLRGHCCRHRVWLYVTKETLEGIAVGHTVWLSVSRETLEGVAVEHSLAVCKQGNTRL